MLLLITNINQKPLVALYTDYFAQVNDIELYGCLLIIVIRTGICDKPNYIKVGPFTRWPYLKPYVYVATIIYQWN